MAQTGTSRYEVGLVLVAGLGSAPKSWDRLCEALPPGVEVAVATKIPEAEGRNEAYGGPVSLAEYFRGIDDAIAAMNAEEIVLIGHSLGCVISSAYSRYGKCRDRLAAQVLLSPLIIRQVESFAHPLRSGIRHPLALAQAAYFVLVAGAPWPASLKSRILSIGLFRTALFWPIDRLPRRIPAELAIEVTTRTTQSTVKSQALNSNDYAANEWVPHPVVRTLYIEGDRDRLGSMNDRSRIIAQSGMALTIIPDAGHWLHIEQPSLVCRHVLAFMTGTQD